MFFEGEIQICQKITNSAIHPGETNFAEKSKKLFGIPVDA